MHSIKQTRNGGYIYAGIEGLGWTGGRYNFSTIWIVKLDSAGNVEWDRFLGGDHRERYPHIDTTYDGGYIVAGETSSMEGDISVKVSGNRALDGWVVKLDSAGNIEWERTLGGSWNDFNFRARQTSDGGYIVAGTVNSIDKDVASTGPEYETSNPDFWAVKLDAHGNIEWENRIGSPDEWYFPKDIRQTSDGGYIIGGGE